jgi:hypothetical protein
MGPVTVPVAPLVSQPGLEQELWVGIAEYYQLLTGQLVEMRAVWKLQLALQSVE